MGSPLYFNLLRYWLQTCEKHHRECNPLSRFWPTRLLFVGHPDPTRLQLRELGLAEKLEEKLNKFKENLINFAEGETKFIVMRDRGGYIALSHCWGAPTAEEKRQFCTTRENHKRRLKGFSIECLPKTFQDAIRVTRELGKHFLWIDSLCIIQDDIKDWGIEARRMEEIYSSAYCTIAASSARGWSEGFLNERSTSCIQVKHPSGTGIYVSDDMDDFVSDVEKSSLGQRAWVLQERVLSRRTIHFASNHTYWECGGGIRCDNFTSMTCSMGRQYFELDPRFPNRLLRSGYERALDFYPVPRKKVCPKRSLQAVR
jgi:hypothetical protein